MFANFYLWISFFFCNFLQFLFCFYLAENFKIKSNNLSLDRCSSSTSRWFRVFQSYASVPSAFKYRNMAIENLNIFSLYFACTILNFNMHLHNLWCRAKAERNESLSNLTLFYAFSFSIYLHVGQSFLYGILILMFRLWQL